MHDLGLADYTDEEIVELQTKVVDLVINSNNNYVVVGEQERFNSPGRYDIFTLEVDASGKIIDRSTIAIANHSAIVRSISKYDGEYMISGTAQDLNDILAGSGEFYFARGHGYLIKLSNSLDPLTSFGTTSINCDYNDGTSVANQNIGFLWKENDYNETNPLLQVQDEYLGRINIIRDSKKLSNGNGSMGIIISNSGLEDNEVFKNKLTELNYGVYSFGKNRNDLPIFDQNIKGLEFSCNEFALNRNIDEIVYGFYESDGEKLSQGDVQLEPAGNVFSNPSGGVNYHLANYTNQNHRYIYNVDEPTLLTGIM